MSKTTLALLGLAALTAAQQSGNVSVVINTQEFSNSNNGTAIAQNSEQVDFSYLVGEWEDDNVTALTNWTFNYEGEDTYELNTEEGDQIFITPKQLGFDIPAILNTVTSSNNGTNITVADSIGYSVAQTYNGVRDAGQVSAANLTNPIENVANNADAYIQSSTQSAIDSLNQAQANQSPSQLVPYLVVDQQYRDALDNLQNSYTQALANLTSAYNTARSASNSAGNQATQAASNAASSAQQSAPQISLGAIQNTASNNAQQAVSSAQQSASQASLAAPQLNLGAIQNAASSNAQQAVSSAQQTASNAQQAVASAPQAATSAATSAVNSAANQAGQATGVTASTQQAANNARQAVVNVPGATVNAATNAANQARQAAGVNGNQ